MRNPQENSGSKPDMSIQLKIEAAMNEMGEGVRWESIFLFSSEGLLMAHSGTSPDYGEDHLLEFAFSLTDLVNLLEEDLSVKEIVISGIHRKKLVFRFFRAWDNPMVVAAVVSGRKGYKRALGKLIKTIQQYP